MKSKAFIIEFQEAVDFVQTYRSLLRNNRFVLRTRIELNLGERVKVRFNIPDGNGVTVRCKVATQIDDQAWGITLPKNEDVRWLQERAVEVEKGLGPAGLRLPQVMSKEKEWETHPGAPLKPEPGTAAPTVSKTETKTMRIRKNSIPSGPVTVDIAMNKGGPETELLHFGAPEAEFVG